jgi:hypothetical protein
MRSQRLEQIACVLLAREQIAVRALDQFEDAVAVGWRRHR